MPDVEKKDPLFSAIREIVSQARAQAYRSSNAILLRMYWEIGRLIVEDEQGGSAKAAYGKAVLKNLSRELTLEFGPGFDESNLRNIRQFYLAFPIRDAVRYELSWTHYRILSRVEDGPGRSGMADWPGRASGRLGGEGTGGRLRQNAGARQARILGCF